MDSSYKSCPICKNKNKQEAAVCRHCGAPLNTESHPTVPTTKNTEIKINYSEKIDDLKVDERIIPTEGVAIYFAGTTKPVEILMDKEFIIGRKIVETGALESVLDLSDFDGFRMGLSRRHAMIRRREDGYEIIDLSSTNGTWLNDERLVPYTPYPLSSGSRLRLSRIQLFVFYQLKEKDK